MTAWDNLLPEQKKHIRELVAHYSKNDDLFRRFLLQIEALADNSLLRALTHSTKGRLKDHEHLRHKLARKQQEAVEGKRTFDVTPENLFSSVTDLVGFRLLHLYTRQIAAIHPLIVSALEEAKLELVEPPFARIWDEESRQFYSSVGLETQISPTMYTSVHYVVRSNSRTVVTAEIQVRTPAEELWGEADHAINYPDKSEVASCREQIRVLARVASSCTRLVARATSTR